jgi:DNA-binding transcriptional MocR family regulator
MDVKGLIELDAPALAALLGHWSDGCDPLNEQLAARIGQAIDRGDIAPGTRLPSERDMARHLGLSRTTIVAAYDRLRDASMVRSRQGSGTRVAPPAGDLDDASAQRVPGLFQPFTLTERHARSGLSPMRHSLLHEPGPSTTEDVVTLTMGALPAPPGLHELIEQTVREDLPRLLADYGYLPFGLPELREAIAGYLTDIGLVTGPDEVLVTGGAQQAIHLVVGELAAPGTLVAIEDPTFLGAVDALRAAGARMLPIPLDLDGMQLEALRRVLRTTAPEFIYVVPTFHNPTGAVLPAGSRRELADMADAHGTLVVEDLTPYLGGDGIPAPIAAYARPDRVVTIGSLSKGGWGGLRIGWIRASRQLLRRITVAKTVQDHGSSVLSQAVAVRVLERAAWFGTHAEEAATERRETALQSFADLLPDWHVPRPRGGLSLWARLPYGDASTFTRMAADHGVLVRPGPVASPQGAFTDHLRVAVGEHPDRLRIGVERLAETWAAYEPHRRRAPSLAVSV